ncbi:flagellar biosynthesis anti-sigma factor FlgM [Paenibacillus sambharensis]|uniref:Negative regulator of flagellin synthesis n=1 Tax=Paenibacillus sambharensis TaxID=1803190 RepID=A0A2W1LS78_9BACL|nr:flagellar biosynthesis anti-sigma factor FlgM [Paenibacillus sambharensis]PZD97832.1 flagellar biosynthesis anti-sigma factor FlgM [Paenibacillus sambharensis]
MKINETNRIGAVNSYQKQQDHRTGQVNKKRQKDEVQISAEAKQLLTSSRVNDPQQAERIEKLKQSVATGTYKVDAGKVAEKLLPYLKQ